MRRNRRLNWNWLRTQLEKPRKIWKPRSEYGPKVRKTAPNVLNPGWEKWRWITQINRSKDQRTNFLNTLLRKAVKFWKFSPKVEKQDRNFQNLSLISIANVFKQSRTQKAINFWVAHPKSIGRYFPIEIKSMRLRERLLGESGSKRASGFEQEERERERIQIVVLLWRRGTESEAEKGGGLFRLCGDTEVGRGRGGGFIRGQKKIWEGPLFMSFF